MARSAGALREQLRQFRGQRVRGAGRQRGDDDVGRGDGGGRPGEGKHPDGEADGGGGRPGLRGAADIADEDFGVRRAQFLQRRDGCGRGPAAAEDHGGGRGRGARVAERVDDPGDVGVVADQPRVRPHCRRSGSNATVLTTPRARATPRTSSTSADHGRISAAW